MDIRKLTYKRFLGLYEAGKLKTQLDLEAELDVAEDKVAHMRFMKDFRRCLEELGHKPADFVPSFPTKGILYILPLELYQKVKACLLKRRVEQRKVLVGTPDGGFVERVEEIRRW